MPVRRLGAGGRPLHVAVRRAVGEHEPARGVRPVAGDDVVGVDHVLPRLRHLGRRPDLDRRPVGEPRARRVAHDLRGLAPDRPPVRPARRIGLVRHHALGEERVERLDRLLRQMPRHLHRPREEARIEQVQDRMLDAADILVDVHPVVGIRHHRRRRRPRRGEAREVPGRVDEGVHRVGLAPRRPAALRAGRLRPGRMPLQRVARLVEGRVVGQPHRQVLAPLRHDAAGRRSAGSGSGSPQNRCRLSPQSRRRNFVTPRPMPCASQMVDRRGDRLLAGHDPLAGDRAQELDRLALRRHVGLVAHPRLGPGRGEDVDHRQPVLPREVEVALVMRRAAEDGAGAVVHQDEVRDIDRQLPCRVERDAPP